MKRFFCKILLFSIPVIIVVGYYAYKYQYMTGDLGRLGNITFDKSYDDKFTNYLCDSSFRIPIKSFEEISDSVPVLVIGDSFSQQGYFIDCMVALLQDNVQVLKSQSLVNKYYPEEILLFLLKKQETLPSIIIIESVERNCITRLANLSFDKTKKISLFGERKPQGRNTFLQKMREYYKKMLNLEQKQSPVLHELLREPLFSCNNSESDLYFISADTVRYSEDDFMNAYKNLDSLFSLAGARNVTLYYMVATDKFDAYKNKIENDFYSQKRYFILPNDYDWCENFYFSKDTIDVLINKGIKDVYYCNDTHWSPIGAKAVGEAMAYKILKTRINK